MHRSIYTPNDFKSPTANGWDFDLQQFAGSGAGLNFANKVLLRCAASASATYDSATQYGPLMWEAAFFSKTSIQLIALGETTAITGWSVTCYGTHDFRALGMSQSPPKGVPAGFTLPSTSWVPIAAPESEDASPDAFAWSNPLTGFGQSLFSPEPWVAIRVVATATSATGDIAVIATRTP